MFYRTEKIFFLLSSQADEADETVKKNVSPFAKTTLLFTRPAQNLASGINSVRVLKFQMWGDSGQ
jgi:hypothetical protein